MRKTLAILGIFFVTFIAMTFNPGAEEGVFSFIQFETLAAFVDLTSLLVVSSIIVAGGILSSPFGTLVDAFIAGFGTTDLPENRGLAVHDVFHRLARLSMAAGLLGMTIGFILILQNLDDPTAVGPAVAVALLSYFYGIVMSEVVFQTSATDALLRTTRAPSPATVDAPDDGSSEGPMGLVRKLLGFAILLPSLFLAILMNGALSQFFDLPSLALVIAVVLLGFVASVRVQEMRMALSSLFSMDRLSEDQAIVTYLVFRRLSDLAVAAGLMGTLIGIVKMLADLDNPEHVGPAMAVALCTTLYGFLLSELCFRPLAADALARGSVTRNVGQRTQNWRLMGLMGGVFMMLTVLFIILLAMATF